MYKKSDIGKKTRRPNWFFSKDEDWRDLSAAAAEYYKVFPDNAQPDSHQFLQYCQHGPSPKGNEEPWCREAIKEVDYQKQIVAVAPKSYGNFMARKSSFLKKDSDL